MIRIVIFEINFKIMNRPFEYTRFIAAAFWFGMLVFFISDFADFLADPNEYLRYHGPFAHIAKGYVGSFLFIGWSFLGAVFPWLPQTIGRPLVRMHAAAFFLFFVGGSLTMLVWQASLYGRIIFF